MSCGRCASAGARTYSHSFPRSFALGASSRTREPRYLQAVSVSRSTLQLVWAGLLIPRSQVRSLPGPSDPNEHEPARDQRPSTANSPEIASGTGSTPRIPRSAGAARAAKTRLKPRFIRPAFLRVNTGSTTRTLDHMIKAARAAAQGRAASTFRGRAATEVTDAVSPSAPVRCRGAARRAGPGRGRPP